MISLNPWTLMRTLFCGRLGRPIRFVVYTVLNPKGNKKTTEEVKPNSRFRVQFDFEYKGDPGKLMSSEIKTVPDMTLTVRQLLSNHTRGINSEVRELECVLIILLIIFYR